MNQGEKRRHPRLTLRHTAIRNSLVVGKVINLSLSGLALESSSGLRTGSRHTFRMALGERHYSIEAEVRWCRLRRTVDQRPGEVLPIFQTGLELSRPLELFAERGPQSNAEWFDPEVHISR